MLKYKELVLMAIYVMHLESMDCTFRMYCANKNITTPVDQDKTYAIVGVLMDIHSNGRHIKECGPITIQSYMYLAALRWTFQHMNDNNYLDGINIGIKVFDTCGYREAAVKQALDLLPEMYNTPDDAYCQVDQDNAFLAGIVGPGLSESTVLVAEALKDSGAPILTHSSTAASISGLPNVFRATLPDTEQVKVIIDVIDRLNWNVISVIYSDDTYGREGYEEIKKQALEKNICIIQAHMIKTSHNDMAKLSTIMKDIVGTMATSGIIGVVCFGQASTVEEVFIGVKGLVEQNLGHLSDKLQFILPDSVGINSNVLVDYASIAEGAIAIGPYIDEVDEFKDFWVQMFSNRSMVSNLSATDPWIEEVFMLQYECTIPTHPLISELPFRHYSRNCDEVTREEVERKFSQSGYTESVIHIAVTLTEALKIVRQNICKKPNGGCNELLNNKMTLSHMTDIIKHINITYTNKMTFHPQKYLNKRNIQFNATTGDILPDKSVPQYLVHNYKRCGDHKSQHCLEQVGKYERNTLHIDLKKMKFYLDDGVTDVTKYTSTCPEKCITCIQQIEERDKFPVIYIEGDILIMAGFPVHTKGDTSKPFACGAVRWAAGVDLVEAFLFALEQVNKQSDITKDMTFGAIIFDTCCSPLRSQQFIYSVFTGETKLTYEGKILESDVLSKVAAILGGLGSTQTKAMADITTKMKKIQCSYGSTSPVLSKRDEYPYLMRVVTPDDKQVVGMIQLCVQNNWKYVSVVHADSRYGTDLANLFQSLAEKAKICVAVTMKIGTGITVNGRDAAARNAILEKQYNAKVVFLLADLHSTVRFLEEFKNNAKSGIFTFVMSESTNTNEKLKSEEMGDIALGSLSFKMETESNKEFRKEFLEKTPWNIKTNRKWYKEWWKSKFNCHFPDSFDKSGAHLCDPTGHMNGTKEDNWVHYVIQATHALAIGIHSALKSYCVVEPKTLCDEFVDHPKEVIEKIKRVKLKFETTGQMTSIFDEDGNGMSDYGIYNLQLDPKDPRKKKFVHVGKYSVRESKLEYNKLTAKFYDDLKREVTVVSRCDVCPDCPKDETTENVQQNLLFGTSKHEPLQKALLASLVMFLVMFLIAILLAVGLIIIKKREQRKAGEWSAAMSKLNDNGRGEHFDESQHGGYENVYNNVSIDGSDVSMSFHGQYIHPQQGDPQPDTSHRHSEGAHVYTPAH